MWLSADQRDEAFWSFKDLLIFLGVALPCLLGGALLVRMAALAFFVSVPNKSVELLAGQFLGYLMLYLALAALLRVEYERPFWSSLGWRWPELPLPTIAAAGIALAFGIALLGALLKTPETGGAMKEMLENRTSLVLMAILGVTIGPLCEELAFRGFLQPLLVRSLGVAPGILLSGLGFGMLHLPQYGFTWQHGILITLAGTAFGCMRQASRSTAGSTIMHSAYNFALFLGYFAAGSRIPQSW